MYYYAWQNVAQFGADTYMRAEIKLWLNNSQVGTIPASMGGSSTSGAGKYARSMVGIGSTIQSLGNAAGLVDSPDALVLCLTQAQVSQGGSSTKDAGAVSLTPFNFRGSFDTVTLDLEEMYFITQCRFWLGCFSTYG